MPAIRPGVGSENAIIEFAIAGESEHDCRTFAITFLFIRFKSLRRLEAEILIDGEQLFAFLVLGHGRRRLLWIAVTGVRRRSGWHAKSPRHSPGTGAPI
jgi:hypothetical protein